ncbi:sulfite exporter TauE/SafE family protein [Bacillus sp. NP157]|nr:sulfite exporter TauE/SafE family protein [Bacillus sp. NP157]
MPGFALDYPLFAFVLFACTVVAFAISAVSGGGAGLVLMPVLRTGLAMAQVPVALSLGSAISSLARIGVFLRHIDLAIVRWFVPFSLPGAVAGAWTLQHASPVYAECVVGLFLVANLQMLWRKPRAANMVHRPSRIGLAAIGVLAGAVSGFTGAVGLLFNGFYARQGLSGERMVATRAANEALLHMAKLALYAYFGLLTRDAVVAGAIVGAAAVLATFVVRRVLPYLRASLFRRAGYASMTVAGIVMLGGSVPDIAQRHDIALGAQRVSGGFDARLAGFGGGATLRFRHLRPMKVAYAVQIDDLPRRARRRAERLSAGADRVALEAVQSLTRRTFRLQLWRGDAMETHVL